MESPRDKTAFITGGAGGIGLALGRVFLEAGMNLVLADIREERLLGLASEFEGSRVHLMPLDVTDRDALERAAEQTESLFGAVHVLCNNAGVNLFGPLDQATHSDWDWVLGVNLQGVINGLVAFLPRIKAAGRGGHILNTGSVAALVGSSRAGIYAASKAAVCSLSDSLWYDLAPLGIGVSVLCPGLVDTEIYKSHELRPARQEPSGYPVADLGVLGEVHSRGMEPAAVARKAFEGMLRNDLYIFSHPEHKEEFLDRFRGIAGAFPEESAEPARLAFEESRLERERSARRLGREVLGTNDSRGEG